MFQAPVTIWVGSPLAHVQLADPHVVGVRVLFHGQNAPGHHVFQGVVQNLGDLHLGTGDGHGLGKVVVADLPDVYKFIEPFAGKFHIQYTSLKKDKTGKKPERQRRETACHGDASMNTDRILALNLMTRMHQEIG